MGIHAYIAVIVAHGQGEGFNGSQRKYQVRAERMEFVYITVIKDTGWKKIPCCQLSQRVVL